MAELHALEMSAQAVPHSHTLKLKLPTLNLHDKHARKDAPISRRCSALSD